LFFSGLYAAPFKPPRASAEKKVGVIAVSDFETEAWNRARTRRIVELLAAIASGGILVTMVTIFYSILTR
jgi:hypothetical protein